MKRLIGNSNIHISDDEIFWQDSGSLESRKFQMQNRRFLGNKFRLLNFIEDIVKEECGNYEVFCDIFAGTGVVSQHFNNRSVKIISNDMLRSSYCVLRAFLGITDISLPNLSKKIDYLNELESDTDNYFSMNFGGTYFTLDNARKIGLIRENIDVISDSEDEKNALITALIYACDKVANTVGHYDTFRGKLDMTQPLWLLTPGIPLSHNVGNEIFCEDANTLIKEITCDILYLDPPYNSRQYSDTYHLLENLTLWQKPPLYGKARKMNRGHLKSEYCLKSAVRAFADLVNQAKCSHILLSYGNTGESKDSRSNAKMKDEEIIEILKNKGRVQIFERPEKAFTAGKSDTTGYAERIFYCKVQFKP